MIAEAVNYVKNYRKLSVGLGTKGPTRPICISTVIRMEGVGAEGRWREKGIWVKFGLRAA